MGALVVIMLWLGINITVELLRGDSKRTRRRTRGASVKRVVEGRRADRREDFSQLKKSA